jgi:hypothetical protein
MDAIDAAMPAALARHGVPGLAVGVLSHGERTERGYGVASLTTGEPMHAAPLRYPRARRPSGGLFSCVSDLLDFARHQLGGPGPLGAGSLASEVAVSIRDGGIDLVWVELDQSRELVEHPPVHLRPAAPDRFLVRDGDGRGDSVEVFGDGRLLRHGWVFERVG